MFCMERPQTLAPDSANEIRSTKFIYILSESRSRNMHEIGYERSASYGCERILHNSSLLLAQ